MRCTITNCQFLVNTHYAGVPLCRAHYNKVEQETRLYYAKKIVADDRKWWKVIKQNTFAARKVKVAPEVVEAYLEQVIPKKPKLTYEEYKFMLIDGFSRKDIADKFGLKMFHLTSLVAEWRKEKRGRTNLGEQ